MVISKQCLFNAREISSLAFYSALWLILPQLCQIIRSQYHVLRRHDYRLAVFGCQYVIRRQHQNPGFRLSFRTQRQVYCHLIAVEVRIIRRARQRMQFQRSSFRQHRLERLDPQSVQRRRTIQQYRVFFDHFFQYSPYFRRCSVNFLFCRFDCQVRVRRQFFHHERLKQFQRHFFRQSALMQFQFRPYDDNRASRIVHALAQ